MGHVRFHDNIVSDVNVVKSTGSDSRGLRVEVGIFGHAHENVPGLHPSISFRAMHGGVLLLQAALTPLCIAAVYLSANRGLTAPPSVGQNIAETAAPVQSLRGGSRHSVRPPLDPGECCMVTISVGKAPTPPPPLSSRKTHFCAARPRP